MEIDRILQSKKRFEQQKNESSNNNSNNKNKNNKTMRRREKHLMNNKNLSTDMKQLIDWHSKCVIGTCTKVEKDYFRFGMNDFI